MRFAPDAEWLETDGLGGFAMGTVGGIRTRRYHALLCAALTPPAGRHVLVAGIEAWIEGPAGRRALSSQRYLPDVVHPDGATRLVDFEPEPWPRFVWDVDGLRVEHEIVALHDSPVVLLSWRASAAPGTLLEVRPLLAMRDFHALARKSDAFCFDPELTGSRVTFRPHPGGPGVAIGFAGSYRHRPEWFERFLYTEERERGLDCVEDLASPGTFRQDLGRGEAVLLLALDGPAAQAALDGRSPHEAAARIRDAERQRRATFAMPLERAADQFLVRRGSGKTIIAGYPWFGDWGRDTFIALRGLCFATGRLEEARDILLEWAGALDRGMLPNRFPDRGETPELNSVDASLWYVVVARELLQRARELLSTQQRARVCEAMLGIVAGYTTGTRHGIRADASDGLLFAGEPGVQLTWMDAKVGDWVVTPRIGKPVEVQALWIDALGAVAEIDARFAPAHARAHASFGARFWNAERGFLYDVIDDGGEAGRVDAALRPNQIFAVGGLSRVLLPAERARAVVDAVERALWTPVGPRSRGPGEAGYAPVYAGGVHERDGAYHQGTVWPWLAGPFVEAWVRVRGDGAAARREARERFLPPLRAHVDLAGIGHVSEIADAEPPHRPRGCPFQAWSLGELLRLERDVLRE